MTNHQQAIANKMTQLALASIATHAMAHRFRMHGDLTILNVLNGVNGIMKIRHKVGNPFCDGRMEVLATKETHFCTGQPVYAFTAKDRLNRSVRYTIECTQCIEV